VLLLGFDSLTAYTRKDRDMLGLKKGDKVRCLDGMPSTRLLTGKRYTVRAIDGEGFVSVHGVWGWFGNARFTTEEG
jgi:hypothetical protein